MLHLASNCWLADIGVARATGYDMDIYGSRGYCSQLGQDVLVDAIFGTKIENPVFVDVGAHDGVTFSNTYFLEKYRGWRGLCIEANPKLSESLKSNRACHVECCAISAVEGTGDYLVVSGYSEMLSGLSFNYETRHRKRIRKEVRTHGGSVHSIEISTKRLQRVLDTYDIDEIDFLSIDVEGSEFDVIESLDLTRTSVHLMAIENNYNSPKLRKYLGKLGFKRIAILGHDEFFAGPKLMARLLSNHM